MTDDERKSSEDRIREARDRLRDSQPAEPTAADPDEEPQPTQGIESHDVVESRRQESATGPGPAESELPAPGDFPSDRGARAPWYARGWVRWAAIGLVILGFGLFISLGEADRNESGEIVGEGALDVMSMQVGDCFDDPPELEEVVFDVAAVPCSQPHDNEVFAVESVSGVFGETFPGLTALDEHSFEACSSGVFDDYVGAPYVDSALEVFAFTPTEESWEEGDRAFVCALFRLDFSKLTGTARDSGL